MTTIITNRRPTQIFNFTIMPKPIQIDLVSTMKEKLQLKGNFEIVERTRAIKVLYKIFEESSDKSLWTHPAFYTTSVAVVFVALTILVGAAILANTVSFFIPALILGGLLVAGGIVATKFYLSNDSTQISLINMSYCNLAWDAILYVNQLNSSKDSYVILKG